MNQFAYVMINWAAQLPLIIVLAMGIVYALTGWDRHPAASKLGVAGMSLALVVIVPLDTSLVSAILAPLLRGSGGRGLLFMIAFVKALGFAAAWGLMIAAAFHGRSEGTEGGASG